MLRAVGTPTSVAGKNNFNKGFIRRRPPAGVKACTKALRTIPKQKPKEPEPKKRAKQQG
jgi:hypothetical protein